MTLHRPADSSFGADIHGACSVPHRRRSFMIGVSALTLAFSAAAAIGLSSVASAQSVECSGTAAVVAVHYRCRAYC